MSGQLGDLVVSMSMDLARFAADMGKAQKITNDSVSKMHSDLKGAMSSIEGMANKVGGIFTGITAALAGGAMFKSMINTTKDVVGEVTKLTKAFGITAEQASVLRVALDDAFLSVDDAVSASDRLTRAAIKNGAAFEAAGINIKNSDGSLKDSMTVMTEVNSYLLSLKEGKDRDTVAMALYGKSWRELSGILRLTKEAMKDAEERAKELHLVFGPDKQKMMKEYKSSMKDIDDVAESLKVQIGIGLVPELTNMAVAFGDTAVKGIPSFISGLHAVEAEVTRMAMLTDKAGGTMTALMYYMTGGKFTDTGKWWKEQNDLYKKRYEENEKILIKLANAEVGLDENGNPLASKKAEAKKAGTKSASSFLDLLQNGKDAADKENQYIDTWNKLQDKIKEMNPVLTEYQKEIQKANDEYDTLIGKYPEHSKELEHNRGVMLSWIESIQTQKQAIKDTSEYFKEYLRIAESEPQQHGDSGAMNMRWESELKWLKELQPNNGAVKLSEQLDTINKMLQDMPELADEANKAILTLQKPASDSQNKFIQQQYESSMSAFGSGGFGGQMYAAAKQYTDANKDTEDRLNQQLITQDQYQQRMLASKQAFEDQQLAIGLSASEQSIAMMRSAFGDSKEAQLAAMVAEKAIAVARIMMNTEVAASAAIAASAALGPTGVAMGMTQAAAIRAMSYVSIGMIAASGIVEGMQIAGQRALGGPVNSGQTYLVGERGPELFTPGASGMITPNNKLGGVAVNQTVNIDARGTDASVIDRIRVAMNQAKEQAKAEIMQSMNRGGSFALASGRLR